MYAAGLEWKDAAVAIVFIDAVVDFRLAKKSECPLLKNSGPYFDR